MTLEISPPAAADIRAAFGWYEAQREGLGQAFESEVFRLLDLLHRAPLAFRVRYRGLRRAPLRRFPYAVFYSVSGQCVIIEACIHVKRAPTRWPTG